MEDKNYKKLYEEAIERAKEFMSKKGIKPLDDAFKTAKELSEFIFPELKESEDERIRKQILSFLKEFEYDHYRSLDFSSWIAWLEKQGEQKLLNNDKYQTVSVEILDRLYESEKELEQLKQREQKPANNIKLNQK